MPPLHLVVEDKPSIGISLAYGFQQILLAISGILVYPYLLSDRLCAGAETINLRVQLISATFVAAGLSTLLQTTLGLRLSCFTGPAMAFLPPLIAFTDKFHDSKGNCDSNAHWNEKLLDIQGSLFIAAISYVVIGASGLASLLSQIIGPVTVVPLMLLLGASIVGPIEERLFIHWLSPIMLVCVIIFAVYLEDVYISLPSYSFKKHKFLKSEVRVFGQFPYLISLILMWFICFILTVTNLEAQSGKARTDNDTALTVLKESPWVRVPLPGTFGLPTINAGLCIAFVASCIAGTIENLGSYEILARTSEQPSPPRHAVNRGIICEGLGAMMAAVLGLGAGVTTYTENIALIQITRVASRRTMQASGIILIFAGIFTKIAAILATIPEALYGGILAMGASIIAGVAFNNLKLIDLSLTRNLSIMGLAIIIGLTIPAHIEKLEKSGNANYTGNTSIDDMFNMLLSIKMLVGGLVAVFLDNTVPGGTKEQRGLKEKQEATCINYEAYNLPNCIEEVLDMVPLLRRLPFLPYKR